MSYVKGAVLFFVLAMFAGAPSRAATSGDAHPYLTEKFFFDVGIYFPKRELRISVDGTDSATSQEIDFDDELDLSNNDQTGSLNFGWRLGRHWKFSAQYFDTSDRFGATLEDDVEWGDDVFPVGGDVTGGQDFTLVRTLIGYEFNASDKHAFGIGGGLHWLEIGAFIEGDFLLGGPGGPVVNGREAVSAKGVLPNFGAWYRYSLTQNWVLTARYDWLSVAVGDYDGRLVNASVGVNYQMFDHFGVGLNYNFFELDVGVNATDWVGTALTSYKGAFFYLSAYW